MFLFDKIYNIQLSKNNIRQVAYEVSNIRHSPTTSATIRQRVEYFDSPCRRSTAFDKDHPLYVSLLGVLSTSFDCILPFLGFSDLNRGYDLAYLVEYEVFIDQFVGSWRTLSDRGWSFFSINILDQYVLDKYYLFLFLFFVFVLRLILLYHRSDNFTTLFVRQIGCRIPPTRMNTGLRLWKKILKNVLTKSFDNIIRQEQLF